MARHQSGGSSDWLVAVGIEKSPERRGNGLTHAELWNTRDASYYLTQLRSAVIKHTTNQTHLIDAKAKPLRLACGVVCPAWLLGTDEQPKEFFMPDYTKEFNKALNNAKSLPPEVVDLVRTRVSEALTEGAASECLESIAEEARQALLLKTQE